MFADILAPMRADYPDRDVCERCLMTFKREPARAGSDGPLRCPVCPRVFWCATTSTTARCYTMGRRG